MTHHFKPFGFVFFLVATISATMFLASSCSSDEPTKSSAIIDEVSEEYEELSMALDDFTMKFEKEHTTVPASRSFFSRLWKAFKADVFVSCRKNLDEWETTTGISIGASNAAWNQLGRNNMEYSSLSPQAKAEINLMLEHAKMEIDTNGNNLGALHNAVILTLITQDNGDAKSLTEITQNTVIAMKSLGIDVSKIDIAKMNAGLDIFMNEIYTDDDDLLCNRFVKFYPEVKDELSIIKKYCSTATRLQNENDIEEFTNGYKEIIRNSKIEDVSKVTMNRTLSIAPASAQLWNKIDTLD